MTRPSPIVAQVVNRLHVGTPPRDVIAYVRSRLSDEGRSPARRDARKEIYRQALEQHRINREDYAWVMAGCPPRVPR